MIAANSPSFQSTVQPFEAPSLVAMPHSQQPTPPAVPTNKQAGSKTIPCMQGEILKPHPLKPIVPTGFGSNNRVIPKGLSSQAS